MFRGGVLDLTSYVPPRLRTKNPPVARTSLAAPGLRGQRPCRVRSGTHEAHRVGASAPEPEYAPMNEMSKPVTRASRLPRWPASSRWSARRTPSPIRRSRRPYLVEFRALWTGHTPVSAAAGLDRRSLRNPEDRQRDRDRNRSAGRQHRPGRRADPAQRRGRAVAAAHGQDPRGRSGLQHHHLRGRRHACSARARRRPTSTGSIRSCCRRREAAPSAAIFRPTPAAPRRSPTASRARTRSASKWCWPTAASCTTSTSSRRTIPATTCATCSSAPKARSASSPRRCCGWCRGRSRSKPPGRRSRQCKPRSICSGLPPSCTAGGVTSFEIMAREGIDIVLKHAPAHAIRWRPARPTRC